MLRRADRAFTQVPELADIAVNECRTQPTPHVCPLYPLTSTGAHRPIASFVIPQHQVVATATENWLAEGLATTATRFHLTAATGDWPRGLIVETVKFDKEACSDDAP